MQFKTLLTLAATCISLASSAPSTQLAPRSLGTYKLPFKSLQKRHCPKGVQIIAVSGQGGPVIAGYGLLISTVNSIKSAIPNSMNVSVPYPKPNDNGIYKINMGVRNMHTYIPDFVEQCPDTPIVLLGYSAGGIILMNTLCGGFSPWNDSPPISTSYTENVIATILYGEETRAAGQSYDVGTCPTSKGAPDTPRPNSSACQPWANNMQSYCDYQDPRCCTGGNDINQHFVYPSEYDQTVTNYVVQKYNARKAGQS